jgi:hypothetical protein
MVRSIEHLLGYRINRRQLVGFDYQEFEVESHPSQNGSNGGSQRAAAPKGNRKFRRRRSNRKKRTGGKGNGRP